MSKAKNKLSIAVGDKMEKERIILVLILGFMTALEESSMEAEEAEFRFFMPYSIIRLKEVGVRKEVIELVHKGLFLDDVKRLCSNESYVVSIKEIKELALELLRKLPKANEYEHWISND